MQRDVTLSAAFVVMLSAVRLSGVRLIVVRLSAVRLNVMAQFLYGSVL